MQGPRCQRPPIPTLLQQVEKAPPHWAGERIQAWDEDRFRELAPFCRREYWCDNASVNVFRIIGTRHPDYPGLSWLGLLRQGKRMRAHLLQHAQNPDYYLDPSTKKSAMSFVTLDGLDFFVDGQGNHRSAIARFDFHYRRRTMLHGVRISHYDIDTELHRIYNAMQTWLEDRKNTVPWRITPHRTVVTRKDEAGWKIDIYNLAIEIQNLENGDTTRLGAKNAAFQLAQWQHNAMHPIRRIFGLFGLKQTP